MGTESEPDDQPTTYGTMVETALEIGGQIVQSTTDLPDIEAPIGPQDGSPVNPEKPEPPPS